MVTGIFLILFGLMVVISGVFAYKMIVHTIEQRKNDKLFAERKRKRTETKPETTIVRKGDVTTQNKAKRPYRAYNRTTDKQGNKPKRVGTPKGNNGEAKQ
jgi:hypothetical protein